jgi:hypothetical protein
MWLNSQVSSQPTAYGGDHADRARPGRLRGHGGIDARLRGDLRAWLRHLPGAAPLSHHEPALDAVTCGASRGWSTSGKGSIRIGSAGRCAMFPSCVIARNTPTSCWCDNSAASDVVPWRVRCPPSRLRLHTRYLARCNAGDGARLSGHRDDWRACETSIGHGTTQHEIVASERGASPSRSLAISRDTPTASFRGQASRTSPAELA